MQTPHATGSVHKNNEDISHKRGLMRGELSTRIFEQTFDNVAKLAKEVPSKVKTAPLAVFGVGIGVGIAVASLAIPVFFTRKLGFYEQSMKVLKPYRKQLIKALGI